VREQNARAADQQTAPSAGNGRPADAQAKGESGVTPVEPELVARAHAAAAE